MVRKSLFALLLLSSASCIHRVATAPKLGAYNIPGPATSLVGNPFPIAPATLQWVETVTPTLTEATRTSDAATHTITLQGQAPLSSASTNKAPGNINFNIPAPVSGGARGGVSFSDSAAMHSGIESISGSDGGLWLGQSSFGAGKWLLYGSSAATILQSPNAGAPLFLLGSTSPAHGMNLNGNTIFMEDPIQGDASLNNPLQYTAGSPINIGSTSACGMTGTMTLTAVQYASPIIPFVGVMTSDCFMVVPNKPGSAWEFGFSNVTMGIQEMTFGTGLGGNTVEVTSSTFSNAKTLMRIIVEGNNDVVGE